MQLSTSSGNHGRYRRTAAKAMQALLPFLFLLVSYHARSQLIINNPGRLRVFNNVTFNNDVIIKAGTYVDFRGTIRFATNKKLTIEPGAVLRIKNATVTHTSDNFTNTTSLFWGGIILQGNNTSQDGDVARLCQSTFQSCLNGSDMTIIVGEACLGNSFGSFVNGALYLDNANIRYANIGITVDRAGLLHSINSKYENNLTNGINMSRIPANMSQKSLIQNNKFITDFKSSYAVIVGSQIFISENNFYLPISNNEFRHNIGGTSNPAAETFKGIQTHYSAVQLRNNTFHNLLCGIDCHAYVFSTKGRKIENNVMYNCYVGIWNNSSDINILSKNTIYPATKNNTKAFYIYSTSTSPASAAVSGNSPVGIFNQGSLSVYADQNNILKYNIAHSNEIGILNSSPPYTGSGIFYTGNHSYYKNRISKMYINVQSQAYPAPSQQLISHAQFTCNTFEGQYYAGWLGFLPRTYRDVFVAPSHSLQAQGTPSLAAGNNFSALSYSSFRHIYNVGNSFKYHYYNTPAQNPALTTGITKIASAVNSCPASTAYYDIYKSFCSPTYVTPASGLLVGKTAIKQTLDNYRTAILAIETNGVTAIEKDEHDYLTNNYNVEMIKLLDIYYDEMAIETTNPDRYYDSIANYLNTHITFAGRYYSIGLAFDRQDYDLADQYADLLDNWYPNETGAVELGEYIHLLTDYCREPEDSKTQWLQENFETIKQIADDPANFASPKAKEWVQYIADTDPENEFHGQDIYPSYILVDQSEEPNNPPTNPLVNVIVYPNPFSEQLNVSIQNQDVTAKTFVIALYDMNYTLLQSQSKAVNPSATDITTFNTTTLQQGYYVLKVTDNGTEVYNSLIYRE